MTQSIDAPWSLKTRLPPALPLASAQPTTFLFAFWDDKPFVFFMYQQPAESKPSQPGFLDDENVNLPTNASLSKYKFYHSPVWFVITREKKKVERQVKRAEIFPVAHWKHFRRSIFHIVKRSVIFHPQCFCLHRARCAKRGCGSWGGGEERILCSFFIHFSFCFKHHYLW